MKPFVLLVLLLIIGCTPKSASDDYITIGALLPLTGDYAYEGLRAMAGLQLAKDEINQNGGIMNKQLDIIILDDQNDPAHMFKQYLTLMEKDVSAVIGSSYSAVTRVLADVSAQAGIPVITPTATHFDVTYGHPHMFRAIFIDEYQAQMMARFAYEDIGATTAVVFFDMEYEGFALLASDFTHFFEQYDQAAVTAMVHYTRHDSFADLLADFVDSPPDVFYLPQNNVRAAELINTAYEMGFSDTIILGNHTWDGLLAHVHHPGVKDNVFYTAPFSFDDADPLVSSFVHNYFSVYSQMPLAGSAAGYACVYMLADAIERAQSLHPADLTAALQATDLTLTVGRVAFDPNNNPQTNLYVIQIKDGMYATRAKY
jgi:branched-chain amino acid transport system substrate-binding protein